MRKLIFFLLIVIIVLLVPVTFKLSNNLIVNYSHKAVQIVNRKESFQGINIKNLRFANVELLSFNKCIWRDITLQAVFKKKYDFLSSTSFDIHVESMEIILQDVFTKQFLLIVNGITATGGHQAGLKKGRLQIAFEFDFIRPDTTRIQIYELFERITAIVKNGRTNVPLDFSGISSFTINNEPVRAMITTKQDIDGYYLLVVNKEFFQTTAWLMADNITDDEAAILSVNPFKLPKLLEIMNSAKKESEKYKNSKDIPEDAYRHVLWSYLLTMEYGPQFAKKITDAHEKGDSTNSEADHKMDYNNNAIGRAYALKQYKKEHILTILLRDPKVIRKPM